MADTTLCSRFLYHFVLLFYIISFHHLSLTILVFVSTLIVRWRLFSFSYRSLSVTGRIFAVTRAVATEPGNAECDALATSGRLWG